MNENQSKQLSSALELLSSQTPAEADATIAAMGQLDADFAAKASTHLFEYLRSDRANSRNELPIRTKVGGESTARSAYVVCETNAFGPTPTGNEPLPSQGAAQSVFQDPTVRDRYTDLEILGSGAFGFVCRATDTRSNQVIALKVMRRSDSQSLEFFKREFRYLQGISHTNLVQLLTLESVGSILVIAMEYVPGEDFLSYVRAGARDGHPNIDRLRSCFKQLVEGVTALHASRRLHRDLKPQNVRVTPEGRVVILDFGLAVQVGPQGELNPADAIAAGTVAYMAPEQLETPVQLSNANDYYSLGVMLFEALTGRQPYLGSLTQIVHAKRFEAPLSPSDITQDLPDDLSTLCLRLLARNPRDRPSAHELLGMVGKKLESKADHLHRDDQIPLLGRSQNLQELVDAFQLSVKGITSVVHVEGVSGIGKSQLLDSFCRQSQSAGTVVFRGRCYEHELVPYKAVDPVIDELAGYLRSQPHEDLEQLALKDISSLLKLFPVLERITPFSNTAKKLPPPSDPNDMRRRAFVVLGGILNWVRKRSPLVIHIDDLQWGDTDSTYLIAELVRATARAGVLWICSCRLEDKGNHQLSLLDQTLAEIDVNPKRICLQPLTEAQVVQLAEYVLGKEASHHAAMVFNESQGHPYFATELLYAIRSDLNKVSPGRISLDELLYSRVSQLSPAAQRLLQVVAVSGRPLRELDAYKSLPDVTDVSTAARQLESVRLLRGIGTSESLYLETYHERIREVLNRELSADAKANIHGCLASILEQSGRAEFDQLAFHFRGSGDQAKAAVYFEKAGDQAAEAAAFSQASEFLRQSLELLERCQADSSSIRKKLANALFNGGNGSEAATLFLSLAQEASGVRALELQRRAMDAKFQSGRTDEGAELLSNLLNILDEKVPASREQATEWMMTTFAQLQQRGTEYAEKPIEDIPVEFLWMQDLFYVAGWRTYSRDCIPGTYYFLKSALTALQTGEPRRVARALASVATVKVFGGDPQLRPEGWEMLKQASQLVNKLNEPYWSAYLAMKLGFCHWSEGRWLEAERNFSVAEDLATKWQVAFNDFSTDMHKVSVHCKKMIGSWNDFTEQTGSLLRAARQQDNQYLRCSMLVAYSLAELIAGKPDLAEVINQEAWDLWPAIRHISAGHERLTAFVDIFLYRGQPRRAIELVERELEGIRLQTSYEYIEIWLLLVNQMRARALLAGATECTEQERNINQRDRWLVEAESLIEVMEARNMPWANPMTNLLRAGIANNRRDEETAIVLLSLSQLGFSSANMRMYEAAAQWRQGQLIKGSAGTEMIRAAEAIMRAEGVAEPSRIAAMLAPGFPEGSV